MTDRKIESFFQLQQAIRESSERGDKIAAMLNREYGSVQNWFSTGSSVLYWVSLAVGVYKKFFRKH